MLTKNEIFDPKRKFNQKRNFGSKNEILDQKTIF